MKVIISEMRALRTYVSSAWFYVIKALIENHGWINVERERIWQPGHLKRNLEARLGRVPDMILIWGSDNFVIRHYLDLSDLGCKLSYFVEDLHHHSGSSRHFTRIAMDMSDLVFAAYANAIPRFFPEIAQAKEVVWVPHAASPLFKRPFNPEAENKIFLSGAINRHYPLRQQMRELVHKPEFQVYYQPHPGYYCGYNHHQDARVGVGYAERIRHFRAAFTDGLTYQYLVGKHFEIPATGTLLLADSDMKTVLGHMGFVEDIHYIGLTKNTMERTLAMVLDPTNHARLDLIRRQGQELVWQHHNTSDRAALIDQSCEHLLCTSPQIKHDMVTV